MTPRRVPLENVHDEATALLDRAAEAGLEAKAVGGLAVWLLCESARTGPLQRPAKDIDIVALGSERRELSALLEEMGYASDTEFNLYHGDIRMVYLDTTNRRNLDVFLDEFRMCHTLSLKGRLEPGTKTLTPADLLLTKLQIVALTDRDLRDTTALLADCEIDSDRVAAVLASDWGWWRTVTANLDSVEAYLAGADLDASIRGRAEAQIERLREAIAGKKKSMKWKTRARIGERVQWYEVPEESVEDDPHPGAG